MKKFMKRNLLPILFLCVFAILLWKFPFVMSLLCIFFVCFSLVLSISSILREHKYSENPRLKITKDILILTFTLLLVIALGGIAGMYANQYANQHFGMMAGILFALVASFTVGYLVRWGIGRVAKY